MKKVWDMKVMMILSVVKPEKDIEGTRAQRNNQNHLDHSTIKIS